MASKKLDIPTKLKGAGLAYYIKSPRYEAELGIYSDNKAVLLISPDRVPLDLDAPDIIYTMSAGGKGTLVADTSLFKGTMDLVFELRNQSAEVIPKEEAIEAAERMGISKKLCWRRSALFSDRDDGAIVCWTWTVAKAASDEKGPITVILANDTANVLRVLIEQPPLPSWIKIAAATQEANALHLLELIAKGEKRLTMDIETYDPRGSGSHFNYGLNPWDGRIRMLQIYAPGKQLCAIIDFGPRFMNIPYPKAVIDKIQDIVKGRKVLFHNALFDMGFMTLQWGIQWYWTTVEDTQLMSQNHWAGVKFLPHNLSMLSHRCGFGALDKGLQKSDFGLPLCMQQYIYGAEDTRTTHNVGERLRGFLQEPGKVTNLKAASIDQRYLVVANMIRTEGVPINVDTVRQVRDDTYNYMEPKALAWEEGSGLPRNVHWSKLIPWLEDRGHNVLVYDRATRKEKKSSNKAVLKEAAKTDVVIQNLLDYRVAQKRLQDLDGMLQCNRNGRVFCGIRVLAAQGMGRTSSGQIIKGEYQTLNLQNISTENREYPELPDVRQCFEAPEGFSFIVIDLSSAHLRLAAYFAEAEGLLPTFSDGQCPHCYNGAIIMRAVYPDSPIGIYEMFLAAYKGRREVFGDISDTLWESDVSDANYWRKISKTAIYTKINFGGPAVFQASLKKVTGIELPLDRCDIVMSALGEAIPEVDSWVKQKLRECNDNSGFTNFNYGKATYANEDDDDDDDAPTSSLEDYGQLVAPTGRMRYVPRYKNTSKGGNTWVSARINDVSAHCWQSPEADIEKITQVRFLHEYIIPNNLLGKVWIPNFVHDEIQAIAHNSVAFEAAEVYGRINREEWAKVCPIIEGVEGDPDAWIGKNWAAVH